jgi:putative hemolysin
MSIELTVVLILLCVLTEGFFSGSEIALVSADRLKLQTDARAGSRRAALVLTLLDRPAVTLSTCLIGTNLSTMSMVTLAAAAVAQRPELPPILTALIIIPLTLTFGEMVPKVVYQHHADRIAPFIAFPIRMFSLLFRPVVLVLEAASRLVGGRENQTVGVTREEILLLMESAPSSDLNPLDQEMIRRVFAFTEADVEAVMVPLIRVHAISDTATCAEAAQAMTTSGHSRLPVYHGRIDRISGVIMHQDLLAAADWSQPASAVARPPLFVPETKPVEQLLLQMRRERQRIAVAVDEYGGAVGIITVEDLLEEIVGEIEDESDAAAPMVRRVGESEWVCSGRAELDQIRRATALEVPDGDYETIAGFLLARMGRVPRNGERLVQDAFELTVHKANERAILEVRIRRTR